MLLHPPSNPPTHPPTFLYRLGWIDKSIFDRTVALLKRANLPTTLPPTHGMTYAKFAETMSIDKKVSDGVLRYLPTHPPTYPFIHRPQPIHPSILSFCAHSSIHPPTYPKQYRLILLKGELGKCVFTSDYEASKLKETIDAYC